MLEKVYKKSKVCCQLTTSDWAISNTGEWESSGKEALQFHAEMPLNEYTISQSG